MKSLKHDTYIVLDLPNKIADKVKEIRSEYRYTMSLPAEITVAGSSGIGVLQYEQDSSNVYKITKDIASRTRPIKGTFGKVSRFPHTDIFFFTLQDESPFRKFHEQLVNSNIKFTDSSFPYKPHCTLCNNSSLSVKETDELLSMEMSEAFILDTVSVYSLQRKPNGDINVHLLERVKLVGE
ncbi:2'-5' RNA ligase family protein [Halobacillus campisalis]|uniref:2'-5' RNA ligase family protein n=1 Tax=Halobacillus campisalis TaxID=435909 RepID=A0ABW2K5R2_9BACI|nr:2'-5' RNA ligase family protein [Halobacillus campisalis]